MPKVPDSIGIKISELGNAGVIKENDVVPINAKTSAGVPFTKSTKINDLRQTLGFENAFLSVDAGLNGTASGDVFFVYESAAKLWVLQYQNNDGVANPILGYDNEQVRLPTSRQIQGISTLRDDLISSDGGAQINLMNGSSVQDAVFWSVPAADKTVNTTSKFGTALTTAINKAQINGSGIVFIPGGTYVLDKTINVTLTRSLTLFFSADAIIYVDTPMDVFNININGKHLNIVGNNARIMSRWGNLDGTSFAAFRLKDSSLDKSLSVTDLKVGMADSTSKFGYAIYGSALNLPTFYRCLLQGNVGIYLESDSGSGANAHAMGAQIVGCEIYTTTYCVDIANQGGLGCEGLLITSCEFISSATAIRIDNKGLTSTSYLPPLWRIMDNHINSYRGLYVKDVTRLFVIGNDFQSKHNPSQTPLNNGIIELGGVQQFHHHNNSYTSIGYNGATAADIRSPIYQFASTLTNGFFNSTGNIYQLDAMTAPAYDFSGTTNITTIITSNERLQSSGTFTSATYKNYVILPPNATTGNAGASAGFDYSSTATLSSGVLALGTRPPQGFTYNIGTTIVANSSTISQITFPSEMVGKEVTLLFAGASITFTHNANMICPDQKTIIMPIPNVVKVFAFNTTQCRIIDIGGTTNYHTDITAAPSAQGSSGYFGAEYFDALTGKYYKYFVGYGWRYFNTVAVGS